MLEIGGREDFVAAAAGAADERVHGPLVAADGAEEGWVAEERRVVGGNSRSLGHG